MASLDDNLLLALDVYDPSSSPGDWSRIARDSDDSSGFSAAAYQKGSEIVIAFRGWDDFDPRDVPSIQRAYDNKPYEQIKDAQKFIDEILRDNPGATISLTGHSLGGSLAAIMAVRNDLPAETFAAIESVDAAHKSMNGYDYDPFGFTLWKIPEADHNQDITRAELGSYAGVTNHLVFGEIGSYNDHTVLFDNQIGVDQVLAEVIKNGILEDDSRFGHYRNVNGTAFTEIVPAHVEGAPYSESFSTAIHALGFHAMAIVFANELTPLWSALPRLAFQFTNDFIATEADGGGFYGATYDFLATLMFDHLAASTGTTTVATAMIDDLSELASAGASSSARANADINTALLQITLQYAATQTLGDSPAHQTAGVIDLSGAVIEADLQGAPTWDPEIAPIGYQLLVDFSEFLLGDAAGLIDNAASRARHLLVEANDGGDTTITSLSNTLDLIFGGRGDDRIAGGSGGDTVFANRGNDLINGGRGADVMSGGNGADRIGAGAGNDVLLGGAGSDRLTGDSGADSFVFTGLNNGPNGDRVMDFTAGVDSFVLDNDAMAGIGANGDLSDAAFFKGPAAHDADDRIIYDPVAGKLFYDPDGTGVQVAVQLAVLGLNLDIDAGDFRII
jgi:hypothetical protein